MATEIFVGQNVTEAASKFDKSNLDVSQNNLEVGYGFDIDYLHVSGMYLEVGYIILDKNKYGAMFI